MGGTGEDDFSHRFTLLSSFRSATTVFENFEFHLVVKDSISLLLNLQCLSVYSVFRVRTEVSREVVQRPAPEVDSPE